jgi:hypothetical protein
VTNRELRDQIEHMHLEMSNHLKKIIGKPVARNVAYFKVMHIPHDTLESVFDFSDLFTAARC